MNKRSRIKQILAGLALIPIIMACQFAGYNISKTEEQQSQVEPIVEVIPSATAAPSNTPEPPTAEPPVSDAPTVEPLPPEPSVSPTQEIIHTDIPPGSVPFGFLVYDVSSKETANEKRAPYGDSYKINRLERPFLEDMTYVPDLDIKTFNFLQSGKWTFVSIELNGNNPNNEVGIQYGIELDRDRDGFGDYLILAKPPFTKEWSTQGVQVWQDENHDTSGVSSVKSDAPVAGDGYEKLMYDGGIGNDPDLAWVRINAGTRSTVQFAFKRTFPSNSYMLGVFADLGMKDPAKLDYIDRFSEAEAGSPIRGNAYYPLKLLWGFDNTCRDAMNFERSGLEPQGCPRSEPTPKPKTPGPTQPLGCQPPQGGCPYGWAGEPYCVCIPG